MNPHNELPHIVWFHKISILFILVKNSQGNALIMTNFTKFEIEFKLFSRKIKFQ